MTAQRLVCDLGQKEENRNVFTNIERKNKRFSADNYVPNQAFKPYKSKLGNLDAILYLTPTAKSKLDHVKKLANFQKHIREKHRKKDRSFDFICLGYKDKFNNIYIYDILYPTTDFFIEDDKISINYFLKKLSKEAIKHSKATFFDHFRDNKAKNINTARYFNVKNPEPACGLVAFIGKTLTENQECMTLKDLASSIVPGDYEFKENISTGVLTMPTLDNQNQSLECAVIEYIKDSKGHAIPRDIFNVKRCNTINKDKSGKFIYTQTPISSSNQDLTGIISDKIPTT